MIVIKGLLTNYIDTILAFFDHLSPPDAIFYLMNVDKNRTFLDKIDKINALVCGKSHKECRGKKKVCGCPLIQAGVTKILLTLMHATINAALYVHFLLTLPQLWNWRVRTVDLFQ